MKIKIVYIMALLVTGQIAHSSDETLRPEDSFSEEASRPKDSFYERYVAHPAEEAGEFIHDRWNAMKKWWHAHRHHHHRHHHHHNPMDMPPSDEEGNMMAS